MIFGNYPLIIVFLKWYEDGGLNVSPDGESEYAFAIRVLSHMANSLEISKIL